jgi:hypothetical protein
MQLGSFGNSRSRIVGIGVIAFGILALSSLFMMTEGGAHPLALKTDVDLCKLLGDDIWAELAYPASDAVARPPETGEGGAAACALELDPVPPGDRWARVARGEDADRVRRIATVRLTTTAELRQQSPNADSAAYTETFDRELVASGWSAAEIQGPWTWGSVYTRDEERAASLAEDHGVVLWVTATGVEADNLVAFTRTASERIHTAD